ncbi:uncharacterized protein LOC127877007 [Dreissena polymorpha]|nr:uncharacterized protein LOC127877007 [Dreissena polymorpha]
MAENNAEPTIRDLMTLMKNVSDRLESVEKKMGGIDSIEKKMCNMKKDLNKLWVALEDRVRKVDERVTRIEDKVDGADFYAAQLSEWVQELEKQRDTLRDNVTYLQSQSMRNNLIFTGVSEDNSNGSEPPETTEKRLRQHLHDACKIARDVADSIKFERVHRSPGSQISGKVRNIVAKFTYFKDRESIRKCWKELDGTVHRVFEQFPQDVIEKRRKLVPKMKEARRQGKRAYLVFDTLYIDGNAVRA